MVLLGWYATADAAEYLVAFAASVAFVVTFVTRGMGLLLLLVVLVVLLVVVVDEGGRDLLVGRALGLGLEALATDFFRGW